MKPCIDPWAFRLLAIHEALIRPGPVPMLNDTWGEALHAANYCLDHPGSAPTGAVFIAHSDYTYGGYAAFSRIIVE